MPPSFRVALSCFLLLLCCPTLAQVTIVNPNQLEVPKQKVQVLYYATCQVVAQEFHKNRGEVEFPLVLVLGESYDRAAVDEEQQSYTLYLHRWDEVQFAASAMRLAIQHMVSHSRRDQMVREILELYNRIGPVSIHDLKVRQ